MIRLIALKDFDSSELKSAYVKDLSYAANPTAMMTDPATGKPTPRDARLLKELTAWLKDGRMAFADAASKDLAMAFGVEGAKEGPIFKGPSTPGAAKLGGVGKVE
jgi:hypothetical protein